MDLKDAGIYDIQNIFTGMNTGKHNKTTGNGAIISGNPRLVNIPAYQRPYRWGKAEDKQDFNRIEKLFEDYDESLTGKNTQYFLGAAVAVEVKDENRKVVRFDIVDGQQRITTLYLINYIRFLLKRMHIKICIEKNTDVEISTSFKELRKMYDNLLVHVDGSNDLVDIEKALENYVERRENDEEVVLSEDDVKQKYWDVMKIADDKNDEDDTKKENVNKLKELFENEKLALTYSRERYQEVLKKSLCSVGIGHKENTSNLDIYVVPDAKDEQYCEPYVEAMKTIFGCVWSHVKDEEMKVEIKIKKAIKYLDDMLLDLNVCLVLTDKREDANKLFEVLNDRAMEVTDFELMKNYFYECYCSRSGDSDDVIDKNLVELDEIWMDEIFSNGKAKELQKMIAYFATVYITKNCELDDKNTPKFSKEIQEKHLKNINEYKYEDIKKDFQIFQMIAILLEEFDIQVNNTAKSKGKMLDAVRDHNYSITYRTFQLLNNQKRTGVLVGLTDAVLACFEYYCSSTDVDEFKSYVKVLKSKDSYNKSKEYTVVHDCADELWKATMLAKDATIARGIAKDMIVDFSKGKCLSGSHTYINVERKEKLNAEYEDWVNNWSYLGNRGKDKIFIYVLMLQLISCNSSKKANSNVIILEPSALEYTLKLEKIELDHLEAQNPKAEQKTNYFVTDKPEDRDRIVNSLGNMMILDEKDNNRKNNVPMKEALKYYKKIEASWMYKEIKELMEDSKYFDFEKEAPKKEFFVARGKRLKKYFYAIINAHYTQEEIVVDFTQDIP